MNGDGWVIGFAYLVMMVIVWHERHGMERVGEVEMEKIETGNWMVCRLMHRGHNAYLGRMCPLILHSSIRKSRD